MPSVSSNSIVAGTSRSDFTPDESLDVTALIEEIVAEAHDRGVAGQAVTPYVLAALHERSGGETRRVNRDLIVANAGLAAEIAAAYATL